MKALGEIIDLGTSIEPGHCEQHGEFVRRRNRAGEIVGSCPRCREERDQRQALEFQERQRLMRLESLVKAAQLPRKFADSDLANYSPAAKGGAEALRECVEYANEVGDRIDAGRCLVLLGETGVGKTHLLVGILKAALAQGVRCRYVTQHDLIQEARDAKFQGYRGSFTNPDLLVLDDLRVPDWPNEREALLGLVDTRYRDGLPTLAASNLSWRELNEALGAPFCDRLRTGGGKVLAITGKSQR